MSVNVIDTLDPVQALTVGAAGELYIALPLNLCCFVPRP